MSKSSSFLSAAAKARIEQHFQQTAEYYGGRVGEEYTATPAIAQTLNDKIILDGNWFLQLINVMPVSQMTGEKIILGLSQPVTSRTDTSGSGERSPKNLVSLTNDPYFLYKTESDVALKYATIDAWAKFPDFAARYGNAVVKAIGNDRVRIGWNGIAAATASNIQVNTNLEDVNKGWLQILREYNGGSQVVTGTTQNPIVLGGATFPNLDSLVYNAINMQPVEFRDDPNLVVLLGRNVVQYAKGKYYSLNGNSPQNKIWLPEASVMDTYGGLQPLVPPYFPPNAILVTCLNNLSIYYQDTSWRRIQQNWPRKEQFEDFNSRNEGYVVEHEFNAALIENITFA